MKYSNNHNIPLPLAVWLVDDTYDYVADPSYISATGIMKPTRQIILGERADPSSVNQDLDDLIPTSIGSAVHDSIERAWTERGKINLKKLGYPQSMIDNVLVNPSDLALRNNPDAIPVFIEQRGTIEIDGMKIGGKFDMCADGILHDIKTTSTFSWVNDSKAQDYILQGSIYKLIHPTKITSDFIRIMFIFTDWQKFRVTGNPDDYPTSRIAYRDYPLMSKLEITKWLKDRIGKLKTHRNDSEENIPLCDIEDLWMSETKIKYYSDETKLTRATKVFDNIVDAVKYKRSKKDKGVLITEPSIPKRCGYCSAYDLCKQKDLYFND